MNLPICWPKQATAWLDRSAIPTFWKDDFGGARQDAKAQRKKGRNSLLLYSSLRLSALAWSTQSFAQRSP